MTNWQTYWALCISPEERDNALVFMFGRILWCILEGESECNRGFGEGLSGRLILSIGLLDICKGWVESVREMCWSGRKGTVYPDHKGPGVWLRSTMDEDAEGEAGAAPTVVDREGKEDWKLSNLASGWY